MITDDIYIQVSSGHTYFCGSMSWTSKHQLEMGLPTLTLFTTVISLQTCWLPLIPSSRLPNSTVFFFSLFFNQLPAQRSFSSLSYYLPACNIAERRGRQNREIKRDATFIYACFVILRRTLDVRWLLHLNLQQFLRSFVKWGPLYGGKGPLTPGLATSSCQ